MGTRTFLERSALLAPAALAPALETGLTRAFGLRDAAALGPQVTAPPPFDLFHDLRWVSVYHNSWVALALELVAILALRSLYVAWMVQRSWPHPDRPPLLAAARRTAVFYALASLLLAPPVVLLFGMAVTHVSYLFFAALPPVVAVALTVHRGAAAHAAGRWWRWRPTWRSAAWVGAAFGWLTATGGLVASSPLPVAVAGAAGAGALNALAFRSIVHDVARAPEEAGGRRWPVPATLALVYLVVVAGARAGFTAAEVGGPAAGAPARAIPRSAHGHPVLVAAGYGSRWSGPPVLRLPSGFVAWRFSYLGLDGRGRPIPYGPDDTLRPLLASAREMAEQVRALALAYGEPVTIVAESEGGLVARTYLLHLYRPATGLVDRLVVLNVPAGEPSVYFPRPGRQGWGVASGWGLRALAVALREVGDLPVSADAPLVRDLVDCRGLVSRVAGAPLPGGVPEVVIRALADAVDGEPGPRASGAPERVFPSVHGGLMGRPAVQEEIFRILSGGSDPGGSEEGDPVSGWARVLAAASGAWHTPGLVRSLLPAGTC